MLMEEEMIGKWKKLWRYQWVKSFKNIKAVVRTLIGKMIRKNK